MCIPGHMCTGGGASTTGVYLHRWGCAYQYACVLGEGHPLQGVYLHSWRCAYEDAYVLGEGHPLQGCTFIAGGVHTRMHVYWGRGIHYRGVPSYLGVCIPGCMCTGGGASTTGVYLHSWGCAYQDAYLATTSQKYLVT